VPHNPNGHLIVDADVEIRTLPNPTAKGKSAFHTNQSSPLFAHPPSPMDIKQGMIGNCYQLSAINAILKHHEGPNLLMDAMVDTGKGRVIIRLFHENAWRQFSVEKSVRWRVGGAHHSRGAIWVNMLEKAFIMLLSKKDYNWESGGQSGPAMQMLLGRAGAGFAGTARSDAQALLNNLLQYCYKGAPATPRVDRVRVMAAEQIFADAGLCTRFCEWNTQMRAGEWGSLTTSARTLPALEKLLTSLDPLVKRPLILFAVGMGAVSPGGRYSADQLDLYARVGRALATQTAVTAETGNVSTGVASGVESAFMKGTAGEARKAGIYATHVYSVIGIEARHRDYLGVVLRNPHGKSGRKYRVDAAGEITGSVATSAGDFWMELGELSKDFTLTFGAAVVAPPRQAMMNELAKAIAKRRGPD
jgi:hypothetical protein